MAPKHIDDHVLELYSLDRLAEPYAAPVEEYLLVCGKCRERLAGWDEYVRAMRAAMRGRAVRSAGA
jgi:anti-sigma factor RsiW